MRLRIFVSLLLVLMWAAVPHRSAAAPVRMDSLIYSPDGRMLAGLAGRWGNQAAIILWDATSGKVLRRIPAPSQDLSWLAYLPDGRLFAGSDFAAALWEVKADGLRALPLPRGHGDFSALALSADGRTLALGAGRGGIWLMNLKTDTVRSLAAPHGPVCDHLAFAPDGHRLAIDDGTAISFWNLDTGTRQWATAPFPPDEHLEMMTFSPGGRTLAYTLNNSVHLVLRVDTVTGRARPPLSGHTGVVTDVVFTANGQRVLSSGWEDRTARVWDSASGRLLRVLAGPQGMETTLRNPHTGQATGRELYPPPALTALALSPDGRTLAGQAGDEVLRWDMETARQIGGGIASPDLLKMLKTAAISPDGRTLFSGHENGVVSRWALPSGVRQGEQRVEEFGIQGLAVSPDGRTVALASQNDVLLWDAGLTHEQGAFTARLGADPHMAWAPDGRTLAVTVENGVMLWDVAAGRIQRTLAAGPRAMEGLAWSSDGTSVITGDTGGTLRLWDSQAGTIRWRRQIPFGVRSVAFSPDGTLVASAGEDATTRLWRTADGTPFGSPLRFPAIRDARTETMRPVEVLAVAFSHDGRLLAAAAERGALKVWDVRTRREIRSVSVPLDADKGVFFTQNSRILVFAGVIGLASYDWSSGRSHPLFMSPGY